MAQDILSYSEEAKSCGNKGNVTQYTSVHPIHPTDHTNPNFNTTSVVSNNIVTIYYNRIRETAQQCYKEIKEELLLLDSKVAQIYKLYKQIEAEREKIGLNKKTPLITKDLTTLHSFTDDNTDKNFKLLEEIYDSYLKELTNEQEEVEVILKACDTYNQKREVLMSYGILFENQLVKIEKEDLKEQFKTFLDRETSEAQEN